MQRRTRFIPVIASAIILAGCSASNGGSNNGAGGPEANGGTPDPSASVSLGLNFGPPKFDPHLGTSQGVDFSYIPPVYDNLTNLGPDLLPKPWLATSWTTSSDGLSWDFKLRSDVKFSDGNPFNAAAVVANFDYIKSLPRTQFSASLAAGIKTTTAVDATTVRFTLTQPDPLLALKFAFYPELSAMVSPAALHNADLASNPVGSGPYKLAQVTTTSATYKKVTGYWNTTVADRAPDKVVLTGIPDDQAKLNAIQSGQLDGVPAYSEDLHNYPSTSGGSYVLQAIQRSARQWILMTDRSKPTLSDPKVRQAISLAINRAESAKTILYNTCAPTQQPFGVGIPGYDKSLDDGLAQDVTKAKQLMSDAGQGPMTLNLITSAGTQFGSFATVIQQQLSAIGITVAIHPVPSANLLSEWATGKYDIALFAPAGPADPQLSLHDYYLTLYSLGPVSPTIQQLGAAASALPVGSDDRTKAFQKVAQAIVQDVTNIPLCTLNNEFVSKKTLRGVEDSGSAYVQLGYFVPLLWVAKS